MILTSADIRLIFEALEAKHGPGYSSDKNVGRLQAKLSLMLEVAVRGERSREAAEGATQPRTQP